MNQTEIEIKIQIMNKSSQTYQFKDSSSPFFNLDFEVMTPTNLKLDHAEKFIIERNSNQPVFYKDMSLEPGEEYGFKVLLTDYAEFSEAGMYVVQGLFYPQLASMNMNERLVSNKLILHIRPPLMLKEMEQVIEPDTGNPLQRSELSPDRVVEYTINARQRSQWEKFFLYLDLEKLLLKNPVRSSQFRQKSLAEREAMIKQFRLELMEEKIEKEILQIPQQFRILQTQYTPRQGTVVAELRFEYDDYTAIKPYTYYLEYQDKYWIIVDYDVGAMRTE